MATVKAGTNFPTTLVSEIFNAVKGKSSIAKMIPSTPIAFSGNTEFVFSMDNKVSVVGESAQKPDGGAKVEPVVIRPIKVVYQSRVSDEFIYASEEARLGYLKAFADGFASRIAEGLDEMIMHGVNPSAGTASQIIGTNNLDAKITKTVAYDATKVDENVNEAIDKVDDATGVILSKTARSAIATLKDAHGHVAYPEFAWGATPNTLGGMVLDSNKSVEANNATARAYVGDFSALKWGFAKEMPIEVIEYGNPDGQGDLKNTNEVVIRSEAFVGWGILDADAFASVVATA